MWTGELNTETTIMVEEDACIGANVTILPAVTIGRGAQIGACSVVTRAFLHILLLLASQQKSLNLYLLLKKL